MPLPYTPSPALLAALRRFRAAAASLGRESRPDADDGHPGAVSRHPGTREEACVPGHSGAGPAKAGRPPTPPANTDAAMSGHAPDCRLPIADCLGGRSKGRIEAGATDCRVNNAATGGGSGPGLTPDRGASVAATAPARRQARDIPEQEE